MIRDIKTVNPSAQELRNVLTKLVLRTEGAAASAVLAVDDHTGDVYELIGVEVMRPEPATKRSAEPRPITILKMVRQ